MEENKGKLLRDEILDCAENLILQKIKNYQDSPESMTDKDCYAFQLLIITEGRIQGIRKDVNHCIVN